MPLSALPRLRLRLPTLFLLSVVLGLGVLQALAAEGHRPLSEWQTASKDELRGRFDEVARNFGAFDSAFLTYTLEFRHVPPTAQALIDSGHLRTPMVNPYTGEPLAYPGGPDLPAMIREGTARAGDIWYVPAPAQDEAGMAAMFLDPNEPTRVKWMRRDTIQYFSAAEHEVIFGAPREEVLTRVIAEQLLTAIEGFVIRFGRVPESLDELNTGDTRAEYTNPFEPGRLVRDSATLSPGDLHYRPISEDTFDLIGWGAAGPVYYYSEEPFHWSVRYDPLTRTAAVRVVTPAEITAVQEAGLEAFAPAPNETLNKIILVDTVQARLDAERIEAWRLAHPDCLDCGSARPYWDRRQTPPICRDAEDHRELPDCCCQDVDDEMREEPMSGLPHDLVSYQPM